MKKKEKFENLATLIHPILVRFVIGTRRETIGFSSFLFQKRLRVLAEDLVLFVCLHLMKRIRGKEQNEINESNRRGRGSAQSLDF